MLRVGAQMESAAPTVLGFLFGSIGHFFSYSLARKMNDDWSWFGWRVSGFHFHGAGAVYFEFLGGFE